MLKEILQYLEDFKEVCIKRSHVFLETYINLNT